MPYIAVIPAAADATTVSSDVVSSAKATTFLVVGPFLPEVGVSFLRRALPSPEAGPSLI